MKQYQNKKVRVEESDHREEYSLPFDPLNKSLELTNLVATAEAPACTALLAPSSRLKSVQQHGTNRSCCCSDKTTKLTVEAYRLKMLYIHKNGNSQ